MFCAADHPFLHLEKHQQTSPAVPLHECKKIIIGSAPVNLVISAENEGLSNAGQIVFTYSSRACVHRISVLLDLLAVKVKLFHWRWTSRDTWCGTNCWSGRASSTDYSSVQVYGGRYPNIPPYSHVHAHDFSSTLPRSAAVLSDYYYNCRHIMNQDQLVRIQYSTDLAPQ